MDWIESKWINKYRGWALNSYDAVHSIGLNKEFGVRSKQDRSHRVKPEKEIAKDSCKKVTKWWNYTCWYVKK